MTLVITRDRHARRWRVMHAELGVPVCTSYTMTLKEMRALVADLEAANLDYTGYWHSVDGSDECVMFEKRFLAILREHERIASSKPRQWGYY